MVVVVCLEEIGLIFHYSFHSSFGKEWVVGITSGLHL